MPRVPHHRALWLANHALPHEPALRAWLSQRRLPRLEVDDVIQETYAVLAELEDVQHIQNSRTYMFSVAHSIVLQHVRRLRVVSIETMAEVDRLGIYMDEVSPERRVADTQELSRIAQLIAALPDKCREAFTLRKVEGLSQREIAYRMGISENTVEKHIGKALRILMDEAKREFGREREAAGGADLRSPKHHDDSTERSRARQRDRRRGRGLGGAHGPWRSVQRR
jgi:RNA polymerase sigma factor (sigma-70 family)